MGSEGEYGRHNSIWLCRVYRAGFAVSQGDTNLKGGAQGFGALRHYDGIYFLWESGLAKGETLFALANKVCRTWAAADNARRPAALKWGFGQR